MGLFRRFVLFFDSFTAPANLRVGGDSDASSICSGVFSFILICCFGYVFAIKSYEVFTYKQVSSSSVVEDKIEINKTKSGQVMVAMRVLQQKGLLEQNQYFQFYAKHVPFGLDYDTQDAIQSEQISFCTLDQWQGVDKQLLINHYDIEKWLCPKQPLNMTGLESQPGSVYINFKIDYCLFVPWCTNVSEIVSYLSEEKKYYGYLTAEFLVLDTAFTLTEKIPIVKTPTYIKAAFTDTAGIVVDVVLAEYEIQTDQSMFPWDDFQYERGIYVYSYESFYSQYDKDWSYLIQFNMQFAAKTMKASRKFGKIDDMLSYAGGLFGIIIGFFGFFMLSYNQYKYQLIMAEGAFNLDKQGNKIRSKDFNFFVYVKYCIFEWVKTIFGREIDWEYHKKIDETREQAGNQMDISYLFKKIYYLQRLSKQKISEDQAICLSVTQPPSLQQVKMNRLFLQYYDKMTFGATSITLADIYPQNNFFSKEAANNLLQDLELPQLIEVVKNYCKDHPQQFSHLDKLELDEQDKQTQQKLAEAFINLPHAKRGRIQGSYPLVILYCILTSKSRMQQVSNEHLFTESQEQKSTILINNQKLMQTLNQTNQQRSQNRL